MGASSEAADAEECLLGPVPYGMVLSVGKSRPVTERESPQECYALPGHVSLEKGYYYVNKPIPVPA